MRYWILFLSFTVLFLGACEDILEVPDISDQQVELLAPSPGSVVNDSIVNFNWNGVADAEAYSVQIATPNFENAAQLVLDSLVVIDTTFVGTRISKQLSNRAYEWRVQALNSGFETGFTVSGFTVDASSN